MLPALIGHTDNGWLQQEENGSERETDRKWLE